MRKAEKRALGEAKAKREAEDRRQSGLVAQRMAREAETKRRVTSTDVAKEMNQKHRSTLLNNGVNPSTGLVFSDYDMAEMERKANTPERRRLFERIRAGRAGTLNEQPPLGGIDDYVDPLPEMTVGDFKDLAVVFYTNSQMRTRIETAESNREQAHRFVKAVSTGGFFEQAAESLDRMAAGSSKVQEALKGYSESDISFTEMRYELQAHGLNVEVSEEPRGCVEE